MYQAGAGLLEYPEGQTNVLGYAYALVQRVQSTRGQLILLRRQGKTGNVLGSNGWKGTLWALNGLDGYSHAAMLGKQVQKCLPECTAARQISRT